MYLTNSRLVSCAFLHIFKIMLCFYLMNVLISLLIKEVVPPPDKLSINLLQVMLRPLLSYDNLHLKIVKMFFMSPIRIKKPVHYNHYLNFAPGCGAEVNLRFEAGI